MIDIVEEAPIEVGAREALLDRTMGRDRFLKASERLRRGHVPARGLALVSHLDREIIGSVRLWDVEAGDGRPALLLGPLAVDPRFQGYGIGSALMQTAIASAIAHGHGAILLVGDPGYYNRFGFSTEHTGKLRMPAPVLRRRFLGLELKPGALVGAAGRIAAAHQPIATPMHDPSALSLAA